MCQKRYKFETVFEFQRNGSPATTMSSTKEPSNNSGAQTDQPAGQFHSLEGTAVEAVRLSLSRPFLDDTTVPGSATSTHSCKKEHVAGETEVSAASPKYVDPVYFIWH